MKNILSIICLTIFLGSCASTTQYVKYSGQNLNKETNAKICIIRPTNYASALKMKIYQDDKLVGKLGPKSYLSWEVNPEQGDVTILSKSENKDIVRINPKAGKTYYIRQRIKVGLVVGRSSLEFIEECEAQKMLAKLDDPEMKYAE